MTQTQRAAIAFALLFLTAGCAAKKTVIGKWQGTAPVPGGRTANAVIEFKTDGTNTTTANMGAATATVSAKYVVKDDKLTMTPSSLSFNGQQMPLPPQAQAAETYTYKLDADKLTLTSPKQSLTLTRVKE